MFLIYRRRAFSISPVAIILALTLLGIVAWKVSFQYDLVPASHPRAASAKSRILRNGASVIIGSGIIAAGVGIGCFFIFRRSQNAANIGMSTWLAVPVSLLSIQAIRTMTSPRPVRPTAVTTTPPTSETSPTQAALERARQQLQQQNQKNLETHRSLTQGPQPPRSSSASPTPSSPPPAAQAPASKAPSPASTLALEKLENEVNTQAAETIARLESTLTYIVKTPRADKADLRKRSEEAAAARELASTLSKRFRGISDEARAVLTNAGSENAQHEAIRFSSVIDAHQRAFACDSIDRILEQAVQEADFLLANFGQWKAARDGKIESKDFSIQSRANSSRFFIESWLKSKDRDFAKLRGE